MNALTREYFQRWMEVYGRASVENGWIVYSWLSSMTMDCARLFANGAYAGYED